MAKDGWPPARLRSTWLFRHWSASAAATAKGSVLLQADALDPRFVGGSALSGLAAWRQSAAPSARLAHVSLVDLSAGLARYSAIGGQAPRFVASVSKVGLMYPAFQLRRDLQVLCNRDKPATDVELREIAHRQWTSDGVDSGRFPRATSTAQREVERRSPRLAEIVELDAKARKVTFTRQFADELRQMIVDSDNEARATVLRRLGSTYVTSVLSQSGKLAGLNPVAWTATTEALATLLTLIFFGRLVGAAESAEMLALLKRGANGGGGSWARFALEGQDAPEDVLSLRAYVGVAGKIGYLYRGSDRTWADHLTLMSDASIVKKSATKAYVLAFSIPRGHGIIPRRAIFPLIRAVHDFI